MDFKVLIADSAIADLKQIVEFVAEDNSEAAIRLGKKLLGHALSLATFPNVFLSTTGDVESARCRYRLLIYYQCDEQTSVVNILHFWHGARRRPEFPA